MKAERDELEVYYHKVLTLWSSDGEPSRVLNDTNSPLHHACHRSTNHRSTVMGISLEVDLVN